MRRPHDEDERRQFHQGRRFDHRLVARSQIETPTVWFRATYVVTITRSVPYRLGDRRGPGLRTAFHAAFGGSLAGAVQRGPTRHSATPGQSRTHAKRVARVERSAPARVAASRHAPDRVALHEMAEVVKAARGPRASVAVLPQSTTLRGDNITPSLSSAAVAAREVSASEGELHHRDRAAAPIRRTASASCRRRDRPT